MISVCMYVHYNTWVVMDFLGNTCLYLSRDPSPRVLSEAFRAAGLTLVRLGDPSLVYSVGMLFVNFLFEFLKIKYSTDRSLSVEKSTNGERRHEGIICSWLCSRQKANSHFMTLSCMIRSPGSKRSLPFGGLGGRIHLILHWSHHTYPYWSLIY